MNRTVNNYHPDAWLASFKTSFKNNKNNLLKFSPSLRNLQIPFLHACQRRNGLQVAISPPTVMAGGLLSKNRLNLRTRFLCSRLHRNPLMNSMVVKVSACLQEAGNPSEQHSLKILTPPVRSNNLTLIIVFHKQI
jgi:hypothetical protein